MVNDRGILFDFDGVIARTMEDNYAAWREVFLKRGLEIDADEFFLMEGKKLSDIALLYGARAGLPEALAESLVKEKDEYYLSHHSFEIYPGVVELLGGLRERKVPTALVTAATEDRLRRSAPADLLAYFSSIITKELGGRGKPFPDPYLSGAEKLGVVPSRSIAVENAPLGVKSAKSAGMYCIGITSTLAAGNLREADEIVESFAELKETKIIHELLEKEKRES